MTNPLTTAERQRILDLVLPIAHEAGEILMSHFGRLAAHEIGSKEVERDLITKADYASERHLVERLRAMLPQHAIEAEEETHDPSRGAGELRWFLDPLDGTINFVHQLPCFAVSLGLWSEAGPEVAIVHAPRLGETFTAIRDGGAFLNGAPIRVSEAQRLGEAILTTGFPYRRGELEHSNLENFGRFFYDVRGLRRMGSAAIDLAYTAAGRYDGYWELHLAPHDVAAGGLLVREAGGLVTDADGGDDWLRGRSLVAAGPGLHGAILERVVH